jgi:hypothetical protein
LGRSTTFWWTNDGIVPRELAMRKPSAPLISSAIMLVVIGGLVIWVVASPGRRGLSDEIPRGSVTFLGYTNDASGARLAEFKVTNQSEVAVAREPHCVVLFKPSGSVWTPQWAVPISMPPRRIVLAAGMSETLILRPPTNQLPWRISVYFSNQVGPTWPIKRLVNAALPQVGLPAPYGVATFGADSEPIEGQEGP